MRRPMPVAFFDGKSYSLRSRKVTIPNFDLMTRIEVLVWLLRHTYARGYSRSVNPLAGMSGVLSIVESKGVNE